MKQVFNDGTMEATEYPEGWLYLRWINQSGFLRKTLVKDLILAEDYIWTYGLKGWFTDSDLEHRDFQMILHKVGAKPHAVGGGFVHFSKWILKEGDKYVRAKATKRTSITSIS